VIVAVAAALAFASSTQTVAVKDNVFGPTSITVSKGTTIKWAWKGKHRHDVTVATGPKHFRSSTMRSGSFSHTMNAKGTYQLVCTVHTPDMKMTVKVK
jgi:plastocyanin